jgi:hypothetical protein
MFNLQCAGCHFGRILHLSIPVSRTYIQQRLKRPKKPVFFVLPTSTSLYPSSLGLGSLITASFIHARQQRISGEKRIRGVELGKSAPLQNGDLVKPPDVT